MALILVAEPESRYVQRIRDALSGEGFEIRTAEGAEEALTSAQAQPPRLAVVSAELMGAPRLFQAFARRTGGPGVVALVPERLAGMATADTLGADEAVVKPFNDGDLRLAVRRVLHPPAVESVPGADTGFGSSAKDRAEALTSEDIFGDLVAEVESEIARNRPGTPLQPEVTVAPPRSPAAPVPAGGPSHRPRRSSDIDRALEETLSGLRGLAARPEPRKPTAPPRRPLGDADVDALLSETLSGLSLPQAKERVKGRPAPKPAPPPSSTATIPLRPVQQPVPPQVEPPRPALPRAEPPPPPVRQPGPPNADLVDLEARLRAAMSKAAPEPPAAPRPAPPAPPLTTAPAPPLAPPAVPQPPPAIAAPAASPVAAAPAPKPAAPMPPLEPAAVTDGASTGLKFGQYTLLERIAVGGMAEVWKARMSGVEGFQKTVAIKKILSHLTGNADFVSMFVDEAKLAAQLNHPNIIHIYDLGKIGEHFYIAMEYVEGMNLRGLLNESRRKALPLPLSLAILVTARLASALDYAHRKRDFEDRELGLVHRDVSPQNVLLSFEGDIKLCDFGIVKAVSKASHTQMGALKGKLQYMSPEQAWGKPVDGRSDIFSLGALFFEMITGQRLFGGDSELSVLEAVRQCRVRAPRSLRPNIPENVEAVSLRALEQNPDRRYQTAGEMQQALENILYSLRPAPSPADLADFLSRLQEAPVVQAGAAEPPAASVAEEPPAAEPKVEVAKSQAPPATVPAAGPPRPQPAPLAPVHRPPATSPATVPAVTAPRKGVEVEEGGRRGKSLLVAVILLLLVLGGLAYVWWSRTSAPPEGPQPTLPTTVLPEDGAGSQVAPTEGTGDLAAPAPGEDSGADGSPSPAGGQATDPAAAGSAAGEAGAAAVLDEAAAQKLIEQELDRRAQEIRRQFEARERELRRQIEKARADEEAAAGDPPPAEGTSPTTDPPAARPPAGIPSPGNE
jgi:serine/threonine protein kinase/DNA-binding response OmpR family regulator